MNASSISTLGRLFWVETVIGAVAGILGLITPFWPDWIEAISGWDPDQHDGSVEWMIVAGLFVVCIATLAMAARERRRTQLAHAG